MAVERREATEAMPAVPQVVAAGTPVVFEGMAAERREATEAMPAVPQVVAAADSEAAAGSAAAPTFPPPARTGCSRLLLLWWRGPLHSVPKSRFVLRPGK